MKLLKRIALVLLLVIAVIIAALTFAWQPEPFAEGSVSAQRLQAGPLKVASYNLVLEDKSRAAAAYNDYSGSASRQLKSTIWHPASRAEGPYPLLVYSHGFSSTRDEGAYLAKHMASLGYVVLAMDFPLTNVRAPGGPFARDVVNQPADISFAIDHVLALSASQGEALEGMVDESRIGAFGLSLGGMTTELLSFHPEMRDSRIGAALSIAGPTFLFTSAFFAHAPELPFLMLAGDIDALVPYAANAAPVPDKMPGAELVTLAGGSHTGFSGPAVMMRWMANPDALGCYLVAKRITQAMESPWYDLLGGEQEGIDDTQDSQLCAVDPLPAAMNVKRQNMITQVVVAAFFQREFSLSADERQAADRYLREELEKELAEVRYETSEP